MAITAAQLLVKIGADVTEAERGMQSVSQQLTSFGRSAAMTGGMLTAGLTLPLVGVAKTAVSSAADYESALNIMQAVSGATAEQMQRVAEEAKRLGADMSLPATSAADAARAMVELSKAGLSVNDTLAAAQGVLQLAAAGNLSEAAAAEIAANALNAFGLSGERATDIANLLAAAANASSGEVTDMADSLKMSAAVFASAGIPIEALVAAISQMANAGIKGSDAGTSLKQMLLRLQAPSDQAAKLMKDLGINIYDAQGKMVPFSDIISQFSSRLGTLTQEQRNAALATIFGSDAVRAANVILMGGVDAHQQMLEAVTQEGAAAELAGARMKGLGGAFRGLQSQIETLLLEVAEPFLTTLEGIVRWVADLTAKIGDLDPNIRNAALAFAAVLAAAGPVVLIIGALSSAFAFLASPIGLVIAAVALLAAAWAADIGGIRDFTTAAFEWISAKVQEIWPAIQEVITSAIQTIREIVTAVLAAIQEFWHQHGDEILAFARTIWNAISQFIDLAIRNIADIVTMVMTTLREFWEENGQQIMEAAQIIWERIWQIISTILQIIQKIWEEHGERILAFAQGIWDAIKAVIETVINVILGIIRLVTSLIRGDWEGVWNAIKDIAESIWNGLYRVFSSILSSLQAVNEIILDSVKALWERIWGGIRDKAKEIWEEIKKTVRAGIDAIVGFFRDRDWGAIGRGIVDGIAAGIRAAWDWLCDTAANLARSALDAAKRVLGISSPSKLAAEMIGRPFVEGIAQGIKEASGMLRSAIVPAIEGRLLQPAVTAGYPASGGFHQSTDLLNALAERIAEAVARRPTYTIQANYRYQDERSLRDDLRLIQMLGAAV